jgi:plastocyanin
VDVLQDRRVHRDDDAVVLPCVEVDEDGGGAEQQAIRVAVGRDLVAQAFAHQDAGHLLDARGDVHPDHDAERNRRALALVISSVTKRSLILPVLAAATIAAGCGGDGYDSQPAAAKSAETATKAAAKVVELTGSTFAPDAVDVKVGETVSFVNRDEIAHTATAGGTFDSKTMDAGATFEFTPAKPGTIRYVCLFHPGMTGTLNVS